MTRRVLSTPVLLCPISDHALIRPGHWVFAQAEKDVGTTRFGGSGIAANLIRV